MTRPDQSAAMPTLCPDETRFAEFVWGELEDAEREVMRAHFDGCTRCTDALGLMVGAFDGDTDRSRTHGPTRGEDPPASGRGEVFAGRYEIRECVGFGAGGTVYAAYDPQLERVIALKILRGSNESDEGGSTKRNSKWTREAKTMAKVVHPNVVAVHDVGVADDRMFIATEFVDGGSLDDWFKKGDRSWSEVLTVFVAAGRGLVAIHECGLVHRDFKPHNVLVGSDGRARVTDFGLARLIPEPTDRGDGAVTESVLAGIDLGATMTTCTRTGTLVGTPAYMSPEQWRGTPADARSDQFSFCVALYQGLWGQRPFHGNSALALAEHVWSGRVAPVPADRKVPAWLERVVMRGLSTSPAERFESVAHLLDALHAAPLRARRRWRIVGLGLGAASVAGLGYAAASFPAEPCVVDDAVFVGLWDEPVRDEVTGHLPDAELAGVVTAELDAWVLQWRETKRAVCDAAQGDQATRTWQFELQQSCLDRRLAELRAATTVLRAVDPARAFNVATTVGGPERCADPAALARIEPNWGSSEARAQALEMADDVARADSLLAAGEYDRSLELAQALVARVGDDAEPAVAAVAWVQLGYAHASLRDGKRAQAALNKAVWAAEASGHVEVAVAAWLELVEVEAGLLDDYDAATRALLRADPAVHRLGDPEQSLSLQTARGLVESLKGNYESALQIQRETIDTAIAFYGERHTQVARMHVNLAAVLSHLGRLDEALTHAQLGVEIQESTVSPRHPAVAEMLNAVGVLQIQLHDIDGARVTYERALSIAEDGWSDDSSMRALLLGNLAHTDMVEKKYDAAIENFTEIVALWRAVHGAEHAEVANALHNLAGAFDGAKDHARAVEIYREALAMQIATVGPEHPAAAGTMHGLGLALFLAGESSEGIEMLDKARVIRDAHNVDPYKRATTRFMLARAYLDSEQLEKALVSAREAADLLRSIAPRQAKMLAYIERWIERKTPER